MEQRSIKEWCVKRNLKYKEVAEKADVSYGTFAHWVRKPSSISALKALRLAQIFECEVRDIIFLP